METRQKISWRPPSFNVMGGIMVIPMPHQQHEISRDALRVHVIDLDAASPWRSNDGSPSMSQPPRVKYEVNNDLFGPQFRIIFGPGRLLRTSQLQAYERYVLTLAQGLKEKTRSESDLPVLDVYGFVEHTSTHVRMP